ncbi:hypothetical protein MK489_20860 [Myxococcota bacterium]|nr:hypothetical protein [Myxococcota bacterium]
MALTSPPEQSEARRGAHNLLVMGTGRLATQVVLVMSAFLIPRVLGADGYGAFAALMALISIVQTGCAFGFPTVEVRFLAPLWRLNDRGDAEVLASSIWLVRLGLSLVGGVMVAVWIQSSPGLDVPLGLVALLVGFALLRFSLESTKSLLLPLGRVGSLAALDFWRAAVTLPCIVFLYPPFGLFGTFAGLAVLHGVLLIIARARLRGLGRIRVQRFRLAILQPHIAFAATSFVSALAGMTQVQFSVYALANWVTRAEAGYLGIAVQLYGLVQVLFISARRSIMPQLSELQNLGQSDRVTYWGGLMMRYSAWLLTTLAVGWSLVGEYVVRGFLTDAFAPVYPCAIWILVASTFFCCGASCNGLLFVRDLPRVGASNTVAFAAMTGMGLLWGVSGEPVGAALRIAGVYALASAFFFATSYLTLGFKGGLWLPLGRTLVLLTPLALAGPASSLELAPWMELAVALAFSVVYFAVAVALRLLPWEEIREIVGNFRGG